MKDFQLVSQAGIQVIKISEIDMVVTVQALAVLANALEQSRVTCPSFPQKRQRLFSR